MQNMAKVEYKIIGDGGHKRIEMQNLVFPNRCACCGAPNPTSSYKGAIGIITGYQRSIDTQQTKYIWKEWDVPYCSFCLKHDKENTKRSNAIVGTFWGIIVWALFAVIGGASLHTSLLAGIAAFFVGLAIIYAIWGRQITKKTKRRPTCFVPTMTSSPRCFSINDGKFSAQSPLYFTFHDKNFETEFIELNGLAPKSQVKEAAVIDKRVDETVTPRNEKQKIKIGWKSMTVGILFFVVAIGSVYFTVKANWPYLGSYRGQPVPSWIPDDTILLERGNSGASLEVPFDKANFAVMYGNPVPLTIFFEETMGMDLQQAGVWRGNNAQVQILSPFSETIAGNSYFSTWGDRIIFDVSGKHPQPHVYVDVTLPVDKANNHQTLNLSVEVDATYPQMTDSIHYQDTTIHLTRQVNLFIVSPDENKILSDRQNWLIRVGRIEGHGMTAGTQVLIAAGVAIVLILLGINTIYAAWWSQTDEYKAKYGKA
jgi:hypothetical protein